LIIVIALIILTLRLSENKYNQINDIKNIKIIDKVQLSKDNSIFILKILNKGYIASVSSSRTDLLKELSEEEITLLEQNKKNELRKVTEKYNELLNKSKDVLFKIKKGKKYDEN
ncbi:MAG: flagellar formation protein, partial [Clostridium sp.]|nr:flagellar formation protein [Clostridium sp.]